MPSGFPIAAFGKTRAILITCMTLYTVPKKEFRQPETSNSEADRSDMSRVERAATYVGPEIIGKLATILVIEPSEFFRRPTRSRPRKKAD